MSVEYVCKMWLRCKMAGIVCEHAGPHARLDCCHECCDRWNWTQRNKDRKEKGTKCVKI